MLDAELRDAIRRGDRVNRCKLKNKLLDRKMLLQEQVTLKYRDSVRCQKLNAKLTQISNIISYISYHDEKVLERLVKHYKICGHCVHKLCKEGKRISRLCLARAEWLCQSRSTF